jgi:hypothetical protein
MNRPTRTFLLALAVTGIAASAQAQGYSRDASRILNAARAAAGGKGWTVLHGWRESGVRNGVHYEAWIDPIRYGMRTETSEPGGKRIHGFNGVADWQIAPDGRVVGLNDHASLARARNDAFFDGWLFFYPSRFDARGAYVGVRSAGGRSYDVLKIQPWGGSPRELWFDHASHRLGRIVDRTGPRVAALRVSDYRRVGPVMVAFRYEPEPDGPPTLARRQIDTLTFATIDRDLFSLPRTPPPAPPKVEAPPTPAPAPEPPKKKKKWWRRG